MAEKEVQKVTQLSRSIDDSSGYLNETDPLALYLKQISKYPLLKVDEEQEIGAG
ncbi:MAG: RNA polymerase sigma factor RpoD/SigA, partial [bacterium]|nr:RNA polymerase sigma factor RpoD/SigA [bacterium]